MNLPEHARQDACILRKRSVPGYRRDSIITLHAEEIENKAKTDMSVQVWHTGQLPPKALFVAEYLNAMFKDAFYGREIVPTSGVVALFEYHQRLIKMQLLMLSSPLGYTALSSLAYAADKVQGIADPAGLQSYACRPIDTELGQTG